MRIGFVTQWFPPEHGTFVPASIADRLGAHGHEVHVVTGYPNYPVGKLYPGYKMKAYTSTKRAANVTIHRAALYPSHDRSGTRRALNYLSFAASASAVARLHVPKVDVWLVHYSPATAALPALFNSGGTRPIALLLQDLWPDSMIASGFAPRGLASAQPVKLVQRYCNWTYRRAAAIGHISPGMREILIERGVPPEKLLYVPNWIDDSFLRVPEGSARELRSSLGSPHATVFVYAGNLGPLQNIGPLVDAFTQTKDAILLVIGEGVDRQALELLARRCPPGRVRFLGHVPSVEIGKYLYAADVHIVSLRDTPFLRSTMPSKLQVALACGRPVLAHAAGDVARTVRDKGVGLVAAPGDISELVAAVSTYCTMPQTKLAELGAHAREAHLTHFSATAGSARLERLLANAISVAAG